MTIFPRLLAVALGLGLALGAGAPATAQNAAEVAVARSVLTQLQARSFAENREYCGYIGQLPDGSYSVTEVSRGGSHSCLSRGSEDRFVRITASFHTHGGYDPTADSEVPSVDDVQGDMWEGINGYVATPGGRLWFIDGAAGVARQLCGVGCVGRDPSFVPGHAGRIAERYSLRDLQRREAGW
jgi:hypothetical protein